MDFSDTLEKMLVAAKAAAGRNWKDVHGFLEGEFLKAKQEAAAIAAEVVAGTKKPEQGKIEIESVEESLKDAASAVKVALKAAAQDAINAALQVLREAINTAIKIPLL